MPKLITVRHLGALPGESHYDVHTPMGTWQVDMVRYSGMAAAGYGTAPHWMVTTPGEDRPDAKFERKRDAVAYITTLVDEDLDKNGGDAARIAGEAHRMELHGDDSPWAKVAEQQATPTTEDAPTIKETNIVTNTGEITVSREAALHAARVALTELKAKGWESNPAYWVGRLEVALTQIVGGVDAPALGPAPVDTDEVTEAARHGETVKVHRATCKSQGDCTSHAIKDRRGGRGIELGAIPACESGTTYGAWSEGAGGFVYSGDCATEVANWAADELRTLAKEDDTDKLEILAVCHEHEEQPKDGCEECNAEADEDEDPGDEAPGPSLDDYAKASRIIQSLIPGVRR
jgi:hypothetical protein